MTALPSPALTRTSSATKVAGGPYGEDWREGEAPTLLE
jgi:hypothetical protein